MNFRQNNYQQNYDDLSKNIITNSGVAKYSQIKSKKKGVPIDKEKLYEDNYDLRNRVKELQEINLKLKTQLTVAEKEKQELFNMAEEEVFHSKLPQRSQSGAHKMSVGNPLDNKSNFTLLKEKQNLTFKKLVREKHNEIEKLRMQNTNIKKTMKFTRLNQLVAENNQLIDETKRLKMQILQARSYTDQFNADYSNRIDNLKRQLQQERDGEKKNGMQLKKQFQIVNELREKLRQAQLKKVDTEKRLNKEIKGLKNENMDLRSKIIAEVSAKQCDKPQCTKTRKDKIQLKKKIDQLQKQVKSLNDDLLSDKKNALQQEFQYKRLLQANKKAQIQNKSKQPNQQKQAVNLQQESTKKQQSQAIKQVQKSVIKNDSSLQQKSGVKQKGLPESKNPVPLQVSKPAEIIPVKAVQPPKIQKNDTKSQVQHKKLSEQSPKKAPASNNIEKPKKTEDHYQSDDTQKLLESLESKPQKKSIPAVRQQKSSKVDLKEDKVSNKKEKQYKESDGQYEQIEFQDQEKPQQKAKEDKKEKTQRHKAKKQSLGKKQSQGKKQKTKEKSTKKLAPKVESDEQILYQNDKKEQNQQGKSQLKLIRQTLTYKFMAQGYTYDEFANLVKQSGKKQFTVTEIMNVLSEEPFLLSQQNIETIIIYLYETDNLTGEEPISNKNFMKKMKKFIGKTKPINQQLQNERISQLVSIIQSDESGKKKIRSQCKKYDLGDGSIDKEGFITIMKEINVKNELLQTALAQIVYISGDINHLNYDFFLKRLADVQE